MTVIQAMYLVRVLLVIVAWHAVRAVKSSVHIVPSFLQLESLVNSLPNKPWKMLF